MGAGTLNSIMSGNPADSIGVGGNIILTYTSAMTGGTAAVAPHVLNLDYDFYYGLYSSCATGAGAMTVKFD